MSAALIVRFRPVGPWRFGPANGARDHVDRVFHSDSLYSAVTIAMRDLDWLDEWLDATARSAAPTVRLSSCYPYARRTLLIQPPKSAWPPAQGGKLRWKTARFVPVTLIPALLRGDDLNEEQWAIEPVSGCLLPVERNNAPVAPFRLTRRVSAPVDRVHGASEGANATSCLQFANSCGMWFVAAFEDDAARETWTSRIRAAVRLLADTGIGGARSRGWGRSAAPAFEDTDFPGFLLGQAESNGGERAWWLLSLFSPAPTDEVDWSRGNYEVVRRSGRIESVARWGELKVSSRMVMEGSVVLSPTRPSGAVLDVGAEGVGHAVYRSGVALAVPIAWSESRRLSWLAAERSQPAVEAAPVEAVPAASDVDAVFDFEYVPEEPVPADQQQPGADEPPAQETPGEEPSVEVPGADEPSVEEPPAQDTAGEEPVPSEPPMEEPPDQERPVDEPPDEEPPLGEPPVEEPPAQEPPTDEPPVKEPGSDEPAGEEKQ